jgi:hypothetical protein
MAVGFARSASKHGISSERALYVLEHHVWAYDVGRGVTLHMGPDRNGIDLEVGTVRRGEDLYVIHAMKLREAFLDEYRRHLPWQG